LRAKAIGSGFVPGKMLNTRKNEPQPIVAILISVFVTNQPNADIMRDLSLIQKHKALAE
jgi:hypothetical protein